MFSVREKIRVGGLALLDLVYPLYCAVCGVRLEATETGMLCETCLRQMPKHRFPASLPGDFPHLDHLWSAAPYEGVLRESLHRLKYEGKKGLAMPLGSLMADFFRDHLIKVPFDGLIPVPLFPARERERGFNQSFLLAKILSKRYSLPIGSGDLIRTRATHPQVSLPRERRIQNVKNAFRVKHPSRLSGKHLLLVDDVVTTGATLSACAKVLKAAGAEKVSALTLAGGTG